MKMKPQLEEITSLFDSSPADSTTTRNGAEETNSNSNSLVKIMEKESRVFVVDKLSSRIDIGMGNSIESNPFVVGSKGYSFTIQLYPDGADRESHDKRRVSLLIKNHSSKTAHVAVSLQIRFYGSFESTFHERETFHEVAVMEPGQVHGMMDFTGHVRLMYFYCQRDCIMIRATIGVLAFDHDHDHDHQPARSVEYERQRCILFKVGDRHFYAQESVIATRCPALLSDYSRSNHIVLISDVDTHVFQAVLWFLHNKKLHQRDRKAIANSKDDDSFAVKMLAAADKFKLKDLRRQCQSFLYYGDSELYGSVSNQQVTCVPDDGVIPCRVTRFQLLGGYYEMEYDFKELWRNVSSLIPQKMEDLMLIPQKMKAA